MGIVTALGVIFRSLISAAVAKFFFSMLLFLAIELLLSALFSWGLLPSWFSSGGVAAGWSNLFTSANSVLGAYGPALAYGLNLFLIPFGLSLTFSAYVVRFIIRRIP